MRRPACLSRPARSSSSSPEVLAAPPPQTQEEAGLGRAGVHVQEAFARVGMRIRSLGRT